MFHHRRLIGHSFITNAKAAEWHFRKRAPFRMKIKYIFSLFFPSTHNHTHTHTASTMFILRYEQFYCLAFGFTQFVYSTLPRTRVNWRKKNTRNILPHLHCPFMIVLLVERGRNRTRQTKNCCSPICIVFSHTRKRLMYHWLRPRRNNTNSFKWCARLLAPANNVHLQRQLARILAIDERNKALNASSES